MAKILTSMHGVLAILPFQCEAPMREALEFLTEVLTSHNGKEKRRSLRIRPRLSFSYTIPLSNFKGAYAFNVIFEALRDEWAIPLWGEAQQIERITTPKTFISCNTHLYDFRNNSLAMIAGNCKSWRIVEIETVTPEGLQLREPVFNIGDASIMPVRVGFVEGEPVKSTNGHDDLVTIQFMVQDLPTNGGDTPPQYEGRDIYFTPFETSNGRVERTFSQDQIITDFEVGTISRVLKWHNSRYSTPAKVVMTNQKERDDFRKWLYRREGAFREFWFPTFEVNILPLNEGLIQNVITAKSDDYEFFNKRRRIAIEDAQGNWVVRLVNEITITSETEMLVTIDQPLNLMPSDILRISFLGLNRLNSDRIEFTHKGGNWVEANFIILELEP